MYNMYIYIYQNGSGWSDWPFHCPKNVVAINTSEPRPLMTGCRMDMFSRRTDRTETPMLAISPGKRNVMATMGKNPWSKRCWLMLQNPDHWYMLKQASMMFSGCYNHLQPSLLCDASPFSSSSPGIHGSIHVHEIGKISGWTVQPPIISEISWYGSKKHQHQNQVKQQKAKIWKKV